MKRFMCMAATLLISTTVLAAGELEINNSPLTLVLSDQNQARVSSCCRFHFSAKDRRKQSKNYLNFQIQITVLQKMVCFSCWLNAYTIERKMVPINEEKPTLAEIIKHFPASSAYTVSHEKQLEVGCTERVSRRFIYLGRHQTISAYFSLFLVRRCYNANKLASVKVNFALSGQTARSTSSASKCPSDSRCQCPLITSQYDRTLICMLPSQV
nr:Uncharacterised protein [Raoultella sp. NCTC 9187]